MRTQLARVYTAALHAECHLCGSGNQEGQPQQFVLRADADPSVLVPPFLAPR